MDDRKVVVITGASAGIGAALAARLAAEGHRLVLAARREAELRQVAEATGGVAVVADVRERADVERLRDEALAAFGHVDVWVNNVGRGIAVPVLKLTDEHVDEMVAVNVKSALYGMQAIVPHFQERGRGHLINVSSFLGRVPYVPIRSMYSACKAALNSLTSNLRMELAAQSPDVHVTLVMPGVVRTEFARNALGATPGGPVPPLSQSAEEVAEAIAAVVAAPRAELYTNPAQVEMVGRYFADVAAFEAGMRR